VAAEGFAEFPGFEFARDDARFDRHRGGKAGGGSPWRSVRPPAPAANAQTSDAVSAIKARSVAMALPTSFLGLNAANTGIAA